MSSGATLLAYARPAGGAATGQVIGASASAVVLATALAVVIQGHRSGRLQLLRRAADWAGRASAMPPWAALPSGISAVSLVVALVGMYWDISLHVDNGRDPGPLANPAHYLILAGLWGIFVAGSLAVALPTRERPGAAAVRLGRDWHAPVGGVLMAACAAFALAGFPLDDIWHRMFGQDVTLWGPTHLMLFGGASMSLVGQALLLAEGARAHHAEAPPTGSGTAGRAARPRPLAPTLRRIAVMGGLLVGLSTVQGEFDFGIAQYRAVFHPMLIALAASLALVAARLWTGPGGALGTAVFFLALRGLVSLLVGPVLGQTTPALALYLPEAVLVELAAAAGLARRPLALGVAGGALAGTVGTAAEWGWSHVVMRLPWRPDLLPEAAMVSVVAGVAGGTLGALLACGLRGRLPRAAAARALTVAAFLAIAACVADGLVTSTPAGARATIVVHADRSADVRIRPARLADDSAWTTVTSWQGGGLQVDRLRRTGPGTYRTTRPIPLGGGWKALVRVQRGRAVVGAPIALPADPAIPVGAVAAPRVPQTRPLVRDTRILQRERKQDVPVWLWSLACAVVGALSVALLVGLSWGVGRVGRRIRPGGDAAIPSRPEAPTAEPTARRPRDPARA